MKVVRVIEREGEHDVRVLEHHDVTHRRPDESMRLRFVLELAYPDRERFVIEEAIVQ